MRGLLAQTRSSSPFARAFDRDAAGPLLLQLHRSAAPTHHLCTPHKSIPAAHTMTSSPPPHTDAVISSAASGKCKSHMLADAAVSADGSVEDSEQQQQWTEECNELLGHVLETQSEIATLLKTHTTATDELQSMKAQCDEELVELQDDAWKLQMYVELQRMGQQLERLASGPGDSKDADAAAGCAGLTKEAPVVAPASEHGTATGHHDDEAGLHELDNEIAELDKQLVAARAELQGLMLTAHAVEGEVQEAGQQLEALAGGGGDA